MCGGEVVVRIIASELDALARYGRRAGFGGAGRGSRRMGEIGIDGKSPRGRSEFGGGRGAIVREAVVHVVDGFVLWHRLGAEGARLWRRKIELGGGSWCGSFEGLGLGDGGHLVQGTRRHGESACLARQDAGLWLSSVCHDGLVGVGRKETELESLVAKHAWDFGRVAGAGMTAGYLRHRGSELGPSRDRTRNVMGVEVR